jgi:DNA-binding NarL/FixJ family response regulator
MHEELIFADRVLKAGARGYITKREATSKVIEAIRRVLQGKIYICDTMIDHFLERSIAGDKILAHLLWKNSAKENLRYLTSLGKA